MNHTGARNERNLFQAMEIMYRQPIHSQADDRFRKTFIWRERIARDIYWPEKRLWLCTQNETMRSNREDLISEPNIEINIHKKKTKSEVKNGTRLITSFKTEKALKQGRPISLTQVKVYV